MVRRILFITLFTILVPCAAGAESLAVPETTQRFLYGAVDSPVISTTPAEARPIGIGPAASGGEAITIQVGLAEPSGPVDIYVGLYAPALSPEFLLVTPGGGFDSAANGLTAWRADVSGATSATLFANVPVTALPLGTYHLYLAMTPANSFTQLYLWQTSFTGGVANEDVTADARSMVSALLSMENGVGSTVNELASPFSAGPAIVPAVLAGPKTVDVVTDGDTTMWQFTDEVVPNIAGGSYTLDGEIDLFGNDEFTESTWTHRSRILTPIGPVQVMADELVAPSFGGWTLSGTFWESVDGTVTVVLLIPDGGLFSVEWDWRFVSGNRTGLFPGADFYELIADKDSEPFFLINEFEIIRTAAGIGFGGVPYVPFSCTGYVKWTASAGGRRGSCRIAGDCTSCM